MTEDGLTIWVVYRSPADFPGQWVLRAQYTGGGGRVISASPHAFAADTLDAVRAAVPPGCVRLERHPDDDPVIYEVWL